MKYKEFCKLLSDAGCYKVRSGANHDIWYSPKTKCYWPIARHGAKEVPTGTAKAAKKKMGV